MFESKLIENRSFKQSPLIIILLVNFTLLFNVHPVVSDWKYFLITPTHPARIVASTCSYNETAMLFFRVYKRNHYVRNHLIVDGHPILTKTVNADTCEDIEVSLQECELHRNSIITSDVRVSITVVITFHQHVEIYLAIPVEEWDVQYYVIYLSNIRFIQVISQHDITILGHSVISLIPLTIDLSRNISHDWFECKEINSSLVSSNYIAKTIVSSKPFGIISFNCPRSQLSFNIESLSLSRYYKATEYITFCVLGHTCSLVVYIPAQTTVNVTYFVKRTATRIHSSEKILKINEWNVNIQSSSNIQVEVIILDQQNSLYTVIVVTPTHLFNTGYICLVPTGFTSHHLIVTAFSNVGKFVLNDNVLKSEDLLKEKSFGNTSVINIKLEINSSESMRDRTFKLYTSPGDYFGCYIYGEKSNMCYGSPLDSMKGRQFENRSFISTDSTVTQKG